MKIPYINLSKQYIKIKTKLLAAVERVLKSGNFILGEEVEKFEKEFARYNKSRYAVGVNSGTDALMLALKTAGIGKGDEVITVANSFVATASSIVLVGAVPVFVDIDWDQNINPDIIEAAITKRTKAIMPVHLTGKPAKMDRICAIAKKHNLIVIEDAAQAAGAVYKGKKVGNWGDFGCFSMHPLKNLNACGDAGMIVTKNKKWADKLRILRNIGLRDRDTCVEIAGNSRLDEMQAALLRVKLRYLEKITLQRRKHAEIYSNRLANFVITPEETTDGKDVFQTYIIQTNERDALKDYLAKQGIDAKIHYPKAIHHHVPFAKYAVKAHLPVTNKIVKHILSLPVDQTLTSAQINYVADQVIRFYNK